MSKQLITEYNIFWNELRNALMLSGATPAQYLAAIQRLKKIEGEDPTSEVPSGQTGYLRGVEPYQAIVDYIECVIHHAPPPFWLNKAEGK